VDTGLSVITRTLQAASKRAASRQTTKQTAEDANEARQVPYSVVFVARPGKPSSFNSHFPQLIALASLNSGTSSEAIRLVGFSGNCEEQLTVALGIPRVSCVAIRPDAPHSRPLIDFVQQHVPKVEISWLGPRDHLEFLPTRINNVEMPIGKAKVKRA
jgi:ribonuclease P/MRP protein subunit POP3